MKAIRGALRRQGSLFPVSAMRSRRCKVSTQIFVEWKRKNVTPSCHGTPRKLKLNENLRTLLHAKVNSVAAVFPRNAFPSRKCLPIPEAPSHPGRTAVQHNGRAFTDLETYFAPSQEGKLDFRTIHVLIPVKKDTLRETVSYRTPIPQRQTVVVCHWRWVKREIKMYSLRIKACNSAPDVESTPSS